MAEGVDIVAAQQQLQKAPTGISGLDDITLGGLPAGRPTLICGSAGCGKTLMAMTFLVNGATLFDEPGVLMTFEERPQDIAANLASLGVDIPGLVACRKLIIDHVQIDPNSIEESGEYDLDGLFVRLGYAIKATGARRVVLDTLEALFAGLSNHAILRAELRRLFDWLKQQGVTAIITGERGAGQLTRHGLEEYVSDCVILLDNRVDDQITTRRLRIVKYRGSAHGSNEYPFLIDDQGISVLPITAAKLGHKTSDETASSGVAGLDSMLAAGGFYRGSSVLLSGSAGTGKTIFASHFADATCRRGERCLYFSFEESQAQIIRNMRSVGLDLQQHVDRGLLQFESARPSLFGLEMHLARMNRDIEQFAPLSVVIDPISAFRGPESEVHSALLRMIDVLKSRGITALFINLLGSERQMTESDHSVSSLMDSWVSLMNVEADGERNRTIYVLKSRGMAHSNQIREYVLTGSGVRFIDVYVGTNGVLTGSARIAQEAREKVEAVNRRQAIERRRRESERKRNALQRQIAELQGELATEESDMQFLEEQETARERTTEQGRANVGQLRGAAG